ncbi:Tomoregulin-2 [Liparis tanakae]|uniref:Tomoregulin-2 n=1 Tax=Liparis tanakae TaxID=230148 RepID=A0A4Z2E292_9TELE|nr:Tomoregulin-2 [Liparis tanakae]
MGPSAAARPPLEEPRRPRQWGATAGGWFRITLVSFLATLPVEQLRAFPSSLSDCQTPTGWNCSGESHSVAPQRVVCRAEKGARAGRPSAAAAAAARATGRDARGSSVTERRESLEETRSRYCGCVCVCV